MKKLVLICMVACMVASNAFGAVSTEWIDIKSIHSGSTINQRVDDDYYPVQFYFDGVAVDSSTGKRPVRSVLNLGTPQAEPFDLNSLAGQKLWYQALPAVLQPVAKDLRIQATNEDISE